LSSRRLGEPAHCHEEKKNPETKLHNDPPKKSDWKTGPIIHIAWSKANAIHRPIRFPGPRRRKANKNLGLQ
jgi:hypothetical protein